MRRQLLFVKPIEIYFHIYLLFVGFLEAAQLACQGQGLTTAGDSGQSGATDTNEYVDSITQAIRVSILNMRSVHKRFKSILNNYYRV